MMKLNDFYKFFYSKWEKSPEAVADGYSIIMQTPGDLPFFLKIALDVCAKQNSEHLVETIVVPDSQLKRGFTELVKTWSKDYSVSPVRVAKFQPLEMLLNRYHRNPFNNCWHQLIRGIEASRTNYCLLHDVDLFLLEPDLLKKHYESCVEKQVACMGVSEVWDPWFKENGVDHIVATWELMFDVNWAKSFEPWEHRAHYELALGELHSFDMMLWTQYQTQPNRITRHEKEWGFVHFNHVTSTYRRFQQHKAPYEDSYFRLLLMRLLINAYDPSDWAYDIPSLEYLCQGVTDPSHRVTYLQEETRLHYPEFRTKLQQLIESPILDDQQATTLSQGITAFDRVYGYAKNQFVPFGALISAA